MISLFITASSIALLVLPVTGIDHSQLRQGIVENYRNAESSEERIENLRFLADSMVDQRNADLDRVKIRFESTASLSETFRLEIVDKINAHQQDLQETQNDVRSSTDIESAKERVSSIVSQHRVYQVFLPQTYGLLAHERVNALIESLTTLRDAMSEKVLVAESFGFDASDVNTALGSAAADLAQATGEIQSARLLLETMSNDDVSTAHDHFASARDHLHSARELVKGAHSSLRQAAAWLKDFAAGR